jgi:hypothetical protein
VHAAQRVALHEVAVLGGDLGDLVLADQGVAAHHRRRRDRRAPSCRRAVVGIPPQPVVVAVRLRDVTERVEAGTQVVRWARVGLGHADARAQPSDALVGDAAGLGHPG